MTSQEPADSAVPGSPMPCSEVQLWMSIKIDGEEVPGETGVRLEEHLTGCQPCERWLQEETERASHLRTYLQGDPAARQDFEEVLLDAAREAGWDGRRLRFRRRGIGRFFGSGHAPWNNSLILVAAAALLLAVAGLGRTGWLFPPEEEVTSTATEGTLSPSILPFFTEGIDDQVVSRVVPDSEGRPVEVRFSRSRYRYQVLPVGDQGDDAADLDDVGVQKSDVDLDLDLELERVESRPVRLISWPYQ